MADCGVCQEAIEGEPPLSCVGCDATYHKSCRLGAGRCVTEGCKRSKGLGESPQVERNRSALQINAFPVVFGFFVGLAIGVPVGAVLHLPLIGIALVALIVGLLAGGVAYQLWGT